MQQHSTTEFTDKLERDEMIRKSVVAVYHDVNNRSLEFS